MQEEFYMPEITNSRGYGIGDISRKTGVNIETVRYYERIGIMPEPDRTEGGNRQYNHEQLKRLHFVKRSRELGFNLEEVRALLKLVDRKDFTCGEVHSMTVVNILWVGVILFLHALRTSRHAIDIQVVVVRAQIPSASLHPSFSFFAGIPTSR